MGLEQNNYTPYLQNIFIIFVENNCENGETLYFFVIIIVLIFFTREVSLMTALEIYLSQGMSRIPVYF